MFHRLLLRASVPFLLACAVTAQVLNFPESGNRFGNALGSIDAIQQARMDFDILTINSHSPDNTPLQSPSGSVSALDLKAPGKAQREYEKGYQLLQRKELHGAVEHLAKAIAIYPSFVAAHNALGTVYLDLNQNERARDEFAKAVALDGHLPSSYLNLGIAQMALKEYPPAEESLRKASSIAPLDLQLSVALAYSEFANHDYPAVVATANEVHGRKHKGAALVHYFAAGAWEGQNNLGAAQHEIETLLLEDPKSPSAEQFRRILDQIKRERMHPAEITRIDLKPGLPSFTARISPTPDEASRQEQVSLQDLRAKRQIAEAEAEPDTAASNLGSVLSEAAEPERTKSPRMPGEANGTGYVLRTSADEVDIFFSATDHGNSVENLAPENIGVRDDNRPPEKILGFRTESQLPLRLGLVVDTSDSVKDRLSFEQKAGAEFVQSVVTDSHDLAFVVGVNNSVLLVRDFTRDLASTSRAIYQLAPAGGTALWDAVAFAADKLAGHLEAQPVARVLVVISDGEDNSSSTSLKQAIAAAIKDEVVVYTVSTRELTDETSSSELGDRALKTLSELTGGATFVPGSLRHLNRSLGDVRQVIRGRYLVSYKPSAFQPDGRYHTVEVTAQRDGHQFKVFARKGYYASAAPGSADR